MRDRLSDEYKNRIKEILPEGEFEAFMDSLSNEPLSGLRVNTLKISVEKFLEISPFELKKVPWTDNGFYYDAKKYRPAKHPFYYAGLYYLQEPSAMAPAAALSPDRDSRVLDLCAAPGGKSTQLAELMENEGTLVVNDISPKRTIPLTKNLIRLGARNFLVFNERPEKLKKVFKGYFSHILVDAPCSGEGMFRRQPKDIENLGVYSNYECQEMQREILEVSFDMLREDGRLVFSTCTFNTIENEENVKWLIDNKDAVSLENIELELQSGVPIFEDAKKLRRIWPHLVEGEGQFMARFKVNDLRKEAKLAKKKNYSNQYFEEFIEDAISDEYRAMFEGGVFEFKEKIYFHSDSLPAIEKVNCQRRGWYLGDLKKKRFEPSVDFALALPAEAFKRVVDFKANDSEVNSYLKGETINYSFNEKGWSVISVEGYPLGWVKKDNNNLKNYYPKGWRKVD